MKHKKINWARVPWTPFEKAHLDPTDAQVKDLVGLDPHQALFLNSRYQVAAYGLHHPTYGRVVHLSFKTRDKQPHHDWRDMQRIKNEIVGPEYDAIELYPKESRCVDHANQYHLFCFLDHEVPLGFTHRLVGEGTWEKSKQRPFDEDVRPMDLFSPEEMDRYVGTLTAAHDADERRRVFLEHEYARTVQVLSTIARQMGKRVRVTLVDGEWIGGTEFTAAQIRDLREQVQASGAGHDCGEWVRGTGTCALCDRDMRVPTST